VDCYTPLVGAGTKGLIFLFFRGETWTEMGQRDKAAADVIRAISDPALSPDLLSRGALVSLFWGNRESYRRICATILDRFRKEKITPNHWLALWACVLAPDAVADYPALVRSVENQVGDHPQDHVRLTILGAMLYRAGRFDDALERLNEAQAAYRPAEDDRMDLADIRYFLAITHHRLGHAEEACHWLTRAQDSASAMPFWPLWWMTHQVLQREARALLAEAKTPKRNVP
jgi:tetratricopeptide (TPR) repeat protein